MNLGELRTYVQDVLGRTDIPEAAYVLAQDDWARKLKLQGNQVEATLASPYTLPDDFLSAVEVRHSDYRLDATPSLPSNIVSGVPDRYTVSDSAISVWPTTTDDLAIIYNAKPARLTNSSDTSEVLTRFEGVAIYGVLFHTCVLIRDAEGKATFEQKYGAAIADALAEDQQARFSGGAMIPTPREVA